MIPLPEMEARLSLINNLLDKTPNRISAEERRFIAQNTQGYQNYFIKH